MEFLPIGVDRITRNTELFTRRQRHHNLQAQHANVIDRLATDNLVIQPVRHHPSAHLPVFPLTFTTAILGLLTLRAAEQLGAFEAVGTRRIGLPIQRRQGIRIACIDHVS